jgi:hypothetical protein
MCTLPLRFRSCIAPLLAVGLLCTTVGCSDGKVRVQGAVTFDGRPIERGTISFDPADGQGPNTGGEIADGSYDLSGKAGATPGKKIVRIQAYRSTGRKVEAGPPAPPGTLVDQIEEYIPVQYNAKTTLTADLVPGKVNELDFNLLPSKKSSR